MKNSIRQILIIGVLSLGMYSLTISTAAEPTIVEVTLEPEEPTPLSTITFTTTITSEDSLDDVRLIVKECNATLGICYPDEQNVSMINAEGTNNYEKDVTLKHAGATYITYYFVIKSDDIWYKFDPVDFNLTIDSSNGSPNGGDGGDGSQGTPGFEVVTFLIAISFCALVFKRKRFR
jgi:hypothetical protein